MLENEAAGSIREPADHAFQADEAGGAIIAVHHEVLQGPLSFDVSAERLGHARPGELRCVVALVEGLLIPGLHLERGRGTSAHVCSCSAGLTGPGLSPQSAEHTRSLSSSRKQRLA